MAEARRLDQENGDMVWETSIAKERMNNARVAFDILDIERHLLVGYLQIPCHLLFDVKLDSTRKLAFLPGVMSPILQSSRESIRITLLIAALNALEGMGADISNAYLTAHTTKKVWTVLGQNGDWTYSTHSVWSQILRGSLPKSPGILPLRRTWICVMPC
jgi:hypothetical protein